MGYKSKILEAIKQLEGTEGIGKLSKQTQAGYTKLKKMVHETRDERTLFMMYQSLREVLAKLEGKENDAGFEMKLPSGEVIKTKSLDEAREKIKESGYKKSEEASRSVEGRLKR